MARDRQREGDASPTNEAALRKEVAVGKREGGGGGREGEHDACAVGVGRSEEETAWRAEEEGESEAVWSSRRSPPTGRGPVAEASGGSEAEEEEEEESDEGEGIDGEMERQEEGNGESGEGELKRNGAEGDGEGEQEEETLEEAEEDGEGGKKMGVNERGLEGRVASNGVENARSAPRPSDKEGEEACVSEPPLSSSVVSAEHRLACRTVFEPSLGCLGMGVADDIGVLG